MKIFILITQPTWGGAQRYVFDLSTRLRDLGNQVYVGFGRHAKPVLAERLAAASIPVREFPDLVRPISPWRDLRCLFSLWRFFRVEHFDVVHLNSSKAGVIGSIAARLAGVKRVVFTAHGFVFNEPVAWPVKLFYGLVEIFASFFRDKIIAVSEFDRQSGERFFVAPRRKFAMIHNGVAVPHGYFLSRQEARNKLLHGLASDGQAVGQITDFSSNKGAIFFVRAAQMLSQTERGVTFAVIGDGPARLEIEAVVAKLGLSRNFIFLGFIPDAERYIRAFDVYICSSLKEGLPYSLLLAGAAGVPVVATRVGGNSEIVLDRHSGLLVPSADVEALATAIRSLLENPVLATSLAAAARSKVEKEFTVEEMLSQTIKTYED